MCYVFLATSAASGHASTVRLWCSSFCQQLISRRASEAVPVTFLANLLYSCAKLPLYPHVSIRVDPELVPNEF